MEKKRKADEKRARRNERKLEQALPPAVASTEGVEDGESDQVSSGDLPSDVS